MDTNPVGLTCLSNGTLVIGGSALSLIDPATGRVIRTLVPAGGYTTSGDVIALPDGMLYWTVDGGNDRVVRVDPSSGATTPLPLLGVNDVYGLGFANSQMFGFSSDGRVLTIDPTSGAVMQNQSLPGSWNGATTNPVRC
jgi:DNA-binding beta-propeller fold protein YncE